ncbi:MAG: hypothetical protein NTW86_05140, partial [Candidatus Sumerlaeota bacterium]|nr:hypothetical protein [Candidatus Sumerlaeota bacterium]
MNLLKRVALLSASFSLLRIGAWAGDSAGPKPPAADWATALLLRFDQAPVADAGPFGASVQGGEKPPLAEGRFGSAYDAGAGGQMSANLPSEALPSGEFTLECWIWLERETEEKTARIIGFPSSFGLNLSKGAPRVSFYMTAGSGQWKSIAAPLSVQTWTHVAAVFDGNTMRLYLNGQPAAEAENPGQPESAEKPFFIGSNPGDGQYRFPGRIDEVRLSCIARTDFMTDKPAERPAPTTRLRPLAADENAQERLTKTLSVVRIVEAPAIDGKLNEPAWQSVPMGRFVDSRSGGEPESGAWVRVACDDQNLYAAFDVFAKEEKMRPGPAGRKGREILAADCVEIFLQPEGGQSPYFQIAANANGGLFNQEWAAPKQPKEWSGEGIEAAGHVAIDDWTVEVKIPFNDLGVAAPKEGARWRANFCRAEKETKQLTAWALTGGSFHAPERFGTLLFGAAPSTEGAAESRLMLQGAVVDPKGAPLTQVPVRTAYGVARTDALGRFRIADLAPGELGVQIESPRYEKATGVVEMKQPVEILEPIVLKEIDPYKPAYDGPIGAGTAA